MKQHNQRSSGAIKLARLIYYLDLTNVWRWQASDVCL